MAKLGLDLGSSSLGWAIRNGDEITKKGVITFSSGMVKGQGGYSSPTRDRREARSKRNLIRARKYRKWKLLEILCEGSEYVPLNILQLETWSKYKKGQVRKFPEDEKFLSWLACDFSYQGGKKYKNPYELRVNALEEPLTKHEFGRVLYHLVQRRGYKDIGESDKETETQIKRRGESGFQKALDNNRTIAEALKNEFLDKGIRARNEYPYREEYQNELELICKAQGYNVSRDGKYGYHDQFVLSLWKAIIWQRPLRSQKGTIGRCTLEPSKLRCSVSHPIFEISRAWQFINTIKYYDKNDEKQSLSQDLRELLFNDVFIKKDNFKFEDIRRYLDKKLKQKAKYNYPLSKKTGKYETSVSGMPFCNGIIKILGELVYDSLMNIENYHMGNAPKIIKGYSILDIWHAIFDFDEEYLESFAIEKLNIENVTVKRNKKEVSLSPLVILKNKLTVGYSDLSLKALKKIIPFLKQGYLYNDAVMLAKLPELMENEWEHQKETILKLAKSSREFYNWHKMIVGITNNLIDAYKGEVEDWRETGKPVRAWKDFEYLLTEDDKRDIINACVGYFGKTSWDKREDKETIISEVGKEYQEFFFDSKRAYREVSTLTSLFSEALSKQGINLNGELYHHSNRKNIYGTKVTDKNTGKDILPIPLIDSIKNPMFNKSMSILRRLVNELILKGEIDEDTEIVVEVARELNDNNKRAAIERYQNERRKKREKIRNFLEEFKVKENKSFNVEERIRDFELWCEQSFEETFDESGKKIINKKNSEILSEKKAIRRYELWMEQKGQCMYTGKMISISQLFSNEIDVEHTIPRSLLPDNTMANLTVCYAKYNRDDKGKLMPFFCKNYEEDLAGIGTAIKPRLREWEKTRDNYKSLFESRLKSTGNEDEAKKNKRIQEKHYFRMHYEYWKDKVERFTTDEVKDSWARRQLVDTQMVSKYAREFLKTYFKKVAVQKGEVTAQFRKIYGFQETDKIKSRNKHSHHAIDAAVLTLIPVNSSRRDALLDKMYKMEEREGKQFTTKPFDSFNSQELINVIENQTLIVNYEKDKILQQTVKKVRKRGKLQYVKDKYGNFVTDEKGERLIKKSQGDTVRSTLYKQTFIGKIRDVERYPDGQPIRKNGDWKYKTGEDEFMFTERKPLKDVLSKVDDIIDPVIREIIRTQKSQATDPQGNKIRHVRVKSKAGQVVKQRVNYRSEHEHKNYYYSAAGSIPYAVMLQKNTNDKIERKMIPVASFEVAKVFKLYKKFTPELYMEMFHPNLNNYPDIKLLKVGQKVLVLNSDREYEQRKNLEFQKNRLYRITQFKYDGSKIMLQYHLEAQSKSDIDVQIKSIKDEIVKKSEIEQGIPLITEDNGIENSVDRKKDYQKRVDDFSSRLKRIEQKTGKAFVKELKTKIGQYKTESSSIVIEGQTPILGLSKKNWNFLYENYDFEVSILGDLIWLSK
ncbi:type II CRISPR RNA-guided endonuclease Cas9 [Mangrovimonas cancribranchiae]|uniref:CRISPR-associated endonuclease Cas9 n=1 Tax=Mangrovimonas cancribranchiae TaxID=3080055 RepID=A0AAU6P4P2_9FLAO